MHQSGKITKLFPMHKNWLMIAFTSSRSLSGYEAFYPALRLPSLQMILELLNPRNAVWSERSIICIWGAFIPYGEGCHTNSLYKEYRLMNYNLLIITAFKVIDELSSLWKSCFWRKLFSLGCHIKDTSWEAFLQRYQWVYLNF